MDTCKGYVDGYELFEEIGSGSYGTVCKARYQEKEYAIKKQGIENDFGDVATVYFKEASLLNLIHHPNIIKPYQYLYHKKNFYIIMPYYQHKAKGIKDYRQLFYSLLSAGYYMEVNNIIHRDLKPNNILYNKGEGIVIDFGLATILFDEKQHRDTGYETQTYFYRAPEVYAESRTYKSKIDVWSMGLVFYELLTGKQLLSHDVLESVYPEYIKETIPKLDQIMEKERITRDFAILLRNMLQLNPEKRFTFEQLLQLPLFGTLPQVTPLQLPFPYPHISTLNTKERQTQALWLLEVSKEYKTSYRIYVTSIMIFDRFFLTEMKQKLQLYATASLALAYTLFDEYYPDLREYVYFSKNALTEEQIIEAMKEIFQALDYQLYCDIRQALSVSPQHYLYLLVSGLIFGISRDGTNEELVTLVENNPDAITEMDRYENVLFKYL